MINPFLFQNILFLLLMFLYDYLIGGTKKDKNGVHLSCNPETEAASFINTEKITTPNIVKNINVGIITKTD